MSVIIVQPDDKFLVVGRTVDGKSFRNVYDNYLWALSINLYHGRVYLLRNGRRKLIKKVNP